MIYESHKTFNFNALRLIFRQKNRYLTFTYKPLLTAKKLRLLTSLT